MPTAGKNSYFIVRDESGWHLALRRDGHNFDHVGDFDRVLATQWLRKSRRPR